MEKFFYLFIPLFLITCSTPEKETNSAEPNNEIHWKSFDQSAFDQAKDSGKLVFLEIGANWCHWCHVMDDSTYSDPTIQNYLKNNFVVCREDQDERPDLFAAYRAWGWPAIIVFNESGEELLKLKGYQQKDAFLKKLKVIRKNPEPLTTHDKNTESPGITADEKKMTRAFAAQLDFELGGYNSRNKSLRSNGILYALAHPENDSLQDWMKLTVQNSFQLLDPVWGGVYQYSARYSWDHQHYEKLLRIQTGYIKAYAVYGARTNQPETIKNAEAILNYCNRFLGSDSPLYITSQNADLVSGVHSEEYYKLSETERLKQGTPSVDEHIYLKENAEMATALTYLWAATNNEDYLMKGQAILDYLLSQFKHSNGLFLHQKGQDDIIPFEDNRELLDALLQYYSITDKKIYLDQAILLGELLLNTFNSQNGLLSVTGEVALQPAVVPLDNLNAVLTYHKLYTITGEKRFFDFAKATYKKLRQKRLMRSAFALPDLIRAEQALKTEPFHALYITDGSTPDLRASYLKAILLHPDPNLIFEPLEIDQMTSEEISLYGGYSPGTLFMCTSSFCSAPINNPNQLITFLDEQLE